MIAAELAQRRLVQLKQNLAQFLGFGIAGCETLSVNLSQRADEGVAVFDADFAILVAVASVETRFAHAALPLSQCQSDRLFLRGREGNSQRAITSDPASEMKARFKQPCAPV